MFRVLCLSKPVRHESPFGYQRVLHLLYPHRRVNGLAPSSLELLGIDNFCCEPPVDGFVLLAKQTPKELPEPVAPVRAFVSQHTAAIVDLDLANGVSVIADLDVTDALAPTCGQRVTAQATSSLFEVAHQATALHRGTKFP
nr:hypothetical protein [Planctopirus hydrillae]